MIETQGGFFAEEILKTKALKIYEDMRKQDDGKPDYEPFTASNGWIQRFKKRYNISLKQCSGESFALQNENFDDFYLLFEEKLKQYGEKNVFNCDETALFYKLAPSKGLVTKIRNGVKKYKDRVTVLLSCNMEGTEKLKPFILGKFKNPRALKNFDKNFFCRYSNNANAWMTSLEFNKWLFDWNYVCKKENRKILLILDNCGAHKITTKLSNIELLFLPKNSTSRLQPLDVGIIRSFKAKFYSFQLSSIVNKISSDVLVEELFKKSL